MRQSSRIGYASGVIAAFAGLAGAARQPYDVRKIIDAFREPTDDLVMLCAHRGLRWNGTAENSRDSYFRASEAGLECVETDIHLSLDGFLPMVHDSGLGRTTDVGEQSGKAAYSPFTGQGYNPLVKDTNFVGVIDRLHLPDELGRVRRETVPTLPEMVQSIYDAGTNIVLQLDFKDQDAVAPAYWELKNLTNAAGVPANEWCIYKLQARWWQTPAELEALDWVQDAFASGIRLAYIPVYNPSDEARWDTLTSLNAFAKTNYTISAEIELRGTGGRLQNLLDRVQRPKCSDSFSTAGTFFTAGDFVDQFTTNLTSFDTGNFTLPDDIRVNNSVYIFSEGGTPYLDQAGSDSPDGHDYRTDLSWIVGSGYNWIITDVADVFAAQLAAEGKRNTSRLLADGETPINGAEKGWYRRRRRQL